jgi:hypothetical protein
MSVQPLFEQKKVKLLIDPVTQRVAYLARNGVLPDRVLIVDGPKQQVFTPASCEIVEFSGPLPARITAQNCWGFLATSRGLEPAIEMPLPVERTG